MPYIPNAQNIPPYDGAGGKLLFSIANPTIGVTYDVGVHIQSFSLTRPGSSPYNWLYAGGPSTQFTTDGGVWTGSETGVVDTANALVGFLAPMYGSDWTISLRRFFRYDQATKRFVRTSPKPIVAPGVGTYGTNPSGATDRRLIVETVYTAPAELAPSDAHVGVGRFRLVLPAAKLRDAERHVEGVSSLSAPAGLVTADDVALIDYLSGTTTRIVAHNGGRADNDFNIFVTPSQRQRRALNFV